MSISVPGFVRWPVLFVLPPVCLFIYLTGSLFLSHYFSLVEKMGEKSPVMEEEAGKAGSLGCLFISIGEREVKVTG